MNQPFSNVDAAIARTRAAIEAMRQGRGILVVDDLDRENEGDLIFAADTLTAPQMAMLIRECSGIVCLCLTEEKARQLELPPMVAVNTCKNGTAFTVTIEAAQGVTTGVSAADRVTTVKTAAAADAKPCDLARPGHVFPLIARPGGVLSRRGHTEATVDMCRLAGHGPCGVLCELTNPDGTMAKGDEIAAFAATHDFPLVSVADIVAFRQATGDYQPALQTPPRRGTLPPARSSPGASIGDMIRVLAMADATADTPAARLAKRRFLARWRCLRALRRTLAFIVVVTPFCYFGFLLCCHMPPEWQRGLPDLILLYEWWVFFRNAFTLLRNIWFTPLLAVLPLLVNLVFIVAYPPGQAWKIRRNTYFNQFLPDRLAVIKHIENGDFPGFTPPEGYVALPEAYAHTSLPFGRVSYTRGDNGYTIFFYTSWNVLEAYQGFAFNKEYSKDHSPPQEDYKYMELMTPQWYYLEY